MATVVSDTSLQIKNFAKIFAIIFLFIILGLKRSPKFIQFKAYFKEQHSIKGQISLYLTIVKKYNFIAKMDKTCQCHALF